MADSPTEESGLPVEQYRVIRPVAGLPGRAGDTIHVHRYCPMGWVTLPNGEERDHSSFPYDATVQEILMRAVHRGDLGRCVEDSVWRAVRHFFGTRFART